MILINSSPKNALGIFQPFLPISIPMGIGYIAASLESNGINFKIVDEQVERGCFEIINHYVKKMERPYIFGFSVLTATLKSALTLSEKLKKRYPDSIVIFGGIHPTAMPDEVLSYDSVDIVLRGEGEYLIEELYHLLKHHKDFSHLDSLSFRRKGQIVHNKRSDIIADIDKLPSFPYHLFEGNPQYDLGFVMSSRGCPYNCIFCSNRITTNKAYRYRSTENVIKDLRLLHDKYKQKKVDFFDDNFLVNKKRIFSLTSEIRKNNLHKDMTFAFQARGDNANEEILKELYQSGFKNVFFGIETASNRLLKLIKKGETLEEIVEAVKLSKTIGFHVSATFIYALPTEEHKDRMNNLELSKKLNIDMVRYNNATPYPGTELYKIALTENRLKVQGLYQNFISVSTFIENPFNKIPFTYVPQDNTEMEIRQDLLFSYLSFYFDYRRLKLAFSSPDKGVSWFDAGGGKLKTLIKKIPSLFFLGLIITIKFTELFFNVFFHRKTSIKRKEFFSIFTRFFSDEGFMSSRKANAEKEIGGSK